MVSENFKLSARAKLAASVRHHPEIDTSDLKRTLAAENLASYVSRIVAEAPPLTPEQRDRIASLLRPAGGAHV